MSYCGQINTPDLRAQKSRVPGRNSKPRGIVTPKGEWQDIDACIGIPKEALSTRWGDRES